MRNKTEFFPFQVLNFEEFDAIYIKKELFDLTEFN